MQLFIIIMLSESSYKNAIALFVINSVNAQLLNIIILLLMKLKKKSIFYY